MCIGDGAAAVLLPQSVRVECGRNREGRKRLVHTHVHTCTYMYVCRCVAMQAVRRFDMQQMRCTLG